MRVRIARRSLASRRGGVFDPRPVGDPTDGREARNAEHRGEVASQASPRQSISTKTLRMVNEPLPCSADARHRFPDCVRHPGRSLPEWKTRGA